MREIRAPFLLLPIILSGVGSLLSLYEGMFHLTDSVLFGLALVLFHITVNTLNEYYDHKMGIDFRTRRTVFNGGSGILQEGLLEPAQVLRVSIGSFLFAAAISVYLVIETGMILLPILIPGMIFSLFYTQLFARKMLGEITAGLGLGALPIIGAYAVNTGTIGQTSILLGIAGGILTFNLLLLNEFPDREADRAGGRRNLVIYLGPRRAAYVYSFLTVSVYIILLIFVLLGMIPPFTLLGLLTLPFAYRAVSFAFTDPEKTEIFLNGQRANVQVVLLTNLFIGIGIAISIVLTI